MTKHSAELNEIIRSIQGTKEGALISESRNHRALSAKRKPDDGLKASAYI